jgi:hypothetical protein
MKWPYFHKPIVNIFYGEAKCRSFKRILSDVKLRKSCKKYSELMGKVIEEMEKVNIEALDKKPPV